MKPYEPKTFKEGMTLWLLFVLFCASIGAGAYFGGFYWILPVIGVPASLYGMWRVGGWR